MIRFFASIKLAFWSLAALAGWLCLGAMSASGPMKPSFLRMNDILVSQWFFESVLREPLPATWFLVFCLLGVMVILSFISCTTTTLFKTLKKRSFQIRHLLLFVLHSLFILILLLHVLSMTTGIKQGYMKAFQGDSITLPQGYRLLVTEVRFTGDKRLLSEKKSASKIRYTRSNFNSGQSYVKMILLKNNHLVSRGFAGYMKPFRSGSVFVCLETFISDRKQPGSPGARLTFVKNHEIYPFFVLYSLSAILLILYPLVTRDKMNQFEKQEQ
jgi:hypothetical protein